MNTENHRRRPRYGTLGLAVVFSLFAGAASSQSLAELAKKEKERRKKIGSGESAHVITDRELKSSYGGFPIPPEETPPEGESAEAPAGGAQAPAEEEQPDESKTREFWQKRVQEVKEKIQKLETELNSPEMNWGGGMRSDVNPLGQQNLERRQRLESDLAAARSQLSSIQEEARRAGVPAGWVR